MEAAPDRPLASCIGRYRLLRLLGQGAMGQVLLAHDPVLDREVAVKLLRDDLRIPSEQRRALIDRMRHEARASARVSHPNIIALFDMGEDPVRGLYLVFEYVPGQTLKQRLLEGALEPEAVARLAVELGSALSTAHEAGVLHRDIKPENIILTRNGAKIADFGIARVPDSTLTRDGGLLGTPAYSAPEAIACGDFSPASDQFSMAASLWEALTGRRAFEGDDAVAVASKIALEHPPPIAELVGLDPEVDSVLGQALAKNANARFPSCRAFGEALAAVLRRSVGSPPVMLPSPAERAAVPGGQSDRRATRMVAGGAAVGALATIVGFQLTAHLRPGSASPRLDQADAQELPRATVPVGYLAERPNPKPRRIPTRASSSTPAVAEDRAAADAGPDSDHPSAGDPDAAGLPPSEPSSEATEILP